MSVSSKFTSERIAMWGIDKDQSEDTSRNSPRIELPGGDSRMLELPRDLLFIAVPPILIASILYTLHHSENQLELPARSGLIVRDEKVPCRQVFSAPDTCTFIKEHCLEFDNDGLIPYLQLYFCASPSARPVVLVGMFAWLVVLFASMAVAAGDFLSIHLAVIVNTLRIDQDLAGVTIFAFGNGSSDLFSTLAAMGSGNGSLAISELFGAAAFITTVVLGLVMVIRPFSASSASFTGDVVWFMIAAASLTAFLADGQLVLSECLGILGLYAAFISYSLLHTRRAGVGDFPAPDSQTEVLESEDTRLLASPEYEVAEDDGSSIISLENESVEEPHLDQSSSTDSARANTLPKSIMGMFPSLLTWNLQSVGERILTVFSLPLLIPISLTTLNLQLPTVQQRAVENSTALTGHQHSPLDLLRQNISILPQLFLGPQLVAFVLTTQLGFSLRFLGLVCPPVLLFSALLLGLNLTTRIPTVRLLANAATGFAVSLLWIYLTATSAVSLLTTLGFILDIPTTILGGTIFALGNSSNDLVANTAVARRGMPILAASACFGGPMMNMLLGIGIGGLLQVVKDGAQGPDGKSVYGFEVHLGMFASAATLLVGLAATLAYSFSTGWRLDRPLGIVLILVWVAGTVVNVAVSVAEPQKR